MCCATWIHTLAARLPMPCHLEREFPFIGLSHLLQISNTQYMYVSRKDEFTCNNNNNNNNGDGDSTRWFLCNYV